VEGERLAGVEGEVSARLWNIDVKVVLSELFVECLACSALYRSRGLSMRVRVGVFGLVERRGSDWWCRSDQRAGRRRHIYTWPGIKREFDGTQQP
jgi:hypothetical protein